MSRPVPSLITAVGRGLRRRCPRCGEAPLFRRWFTLHERCAVCGLRFEERPGDQWGFWVLTDRIFLFGAMVALYLGFTPETWPVRILFLLLVAAPLVATMPHRQGAFVALNYLSRARWGS